MPQIAVILAVALAVLGIAALFQGARVKLRLPTAFVCFGMSMWVVGGSFLSAEGPESYATLAILLLGVSTTAGSSYVLMRKLLENDVPTPLPHLIVIVLFPILIAIATLFGIGIPVLENWRTSPTYIFQVIFIYGHFSAMFLVATKRQRDPSRRIRTALFVTEIVVLAAVVIETIAPHYTHFAAAPLGFLAAWAARWPAAWWQAPVDADELLESIGVFLFVVDDQGRLRKWNATAANLVEAIAPRTALQRGLYVEKLLGVTLPTHDGTILEFTLGGGVLRTECQTHEIPMGPGQSTIERVLMLRPLKSRLTSTSLTTPSGELAGYDPETQTLSRRSILDKLEAANVAVRLEIQPNIKSVLVDEVMFVIARRLESAFEYVEWGRLDSWTFAAAAPSPEDADHLADALSSIEGQPIDYGLAVTSKVSIELRFPQENGDSFALRVARTRTHEDDGSWERKSGG